MIDNQDKNEIKIITKEGTTLSTKTYKTTPFEQFSIPRDDDGAKMGARMEMKEKFDKFYPFKEEDNITLTHKQSNHVIFKSETTGTSLKLMGIIGEVRIMKAGVKSEGAYILIGSYSSQVKQVDDIKSINFIVNVNEIDEAGKQIISLLEYRLSWKVDSEDKFHSWQTAQLLGTTKVYQITKYYIA